ncbi:MAG: hypothetical protein ACLTCQ_22885 [Enterocloster bolteae]
MRIARILIASLCYAGAFWMQMQKQLEDVEKGNLVGNTWEPVCRVLLEAMAMMDFKDNMEMLSIRSLGRNIT